MITTTAEQWQISADGTTGWADVTGGDTTLAYTLVAGDAGKYLSMLVTGTTSGGAATQRSNVIGPISAPSLLAAE
jgi:hypothetical protein